MPLTLISNSNNSGGTSSYRLLVDQRNSRTMRLSIASRSVIAFLFILQMSLSSTCFQPKNAPVRTNKPHEYANFPSPIAEETPPVPFSFHQRMLMRVKKNDMQQHRKGSSSSFLIQPVRTMEEFKTALNENHDWTVAFWTSPWCKACKSLQPAMRALAKNHPNVKFIEIPVLDENANLHQGLDVPSVPYLHLYLPGMQLAEEQKLNRKRMSAVHKMLQDYQQGECSLERLDLWSTSCPYTFYPVPPGSEFNSHRTSSGSTATRLLP